MWVNNLFNFQPQWLVVIVIPSTPLKSDVNLQNIASQLDPSRRSQTYDCDDVITMRLVAVCPSDWTTQLAIDHRHLRPRMVFGIVVAGTAVRSAGVTVG